MQQILCFIAQFSEMGTKDTRDLQMVKSLSTFPNQEQFSRGGHSKLSTFENAEMLFLMSGLVGPLTSEELHPL